MVYRIKESEALYVRADEKAIVYQVQMMQKVKWLLPFSWEEETLHYQRGMGKSVLAWLKNEPDQEELLMFITALGMIQKDIEQYLMDWDKLLWDAEWIFWNAEEKRLQMIYCPWDIDAVGVTGIFKGLARLLWQKAVYQKWMQKELILLIFELNTQVAQAGEAADWQSWAERRQGRQKKEETEIALDVLTEDLPKKEKKTIFQIWREKIPFVLR